MSFTRLTRALLVLALAKVAAGVWVGVATLAQLDAPFSSRILVFLGFVLCHTLAATLLLVGRGERAADLLGALLLLTATPYAGAAIRRSAELVEVAPLSAFFHYLQFDAVTPLFLWLFAGAFPNETPLGRPQRVLRWGTRAALAAAVVLFGVNLLMFAGRWWAPLSEEGVLGLLRARSQGSYYWLVVFTLDTASLTFLVWKARWAHVLERRRVQLFVGGIVFGNAPLILFTIGQYVSTAIAEVPNHPRQLFVALLLLDATKITIPFTTAYAVLVERVLDYQLILRKALRYALGRYTILAVAAAPLLLFAVFLFAHRDESLNEILAGRPARIVLPLVAASLVALRFRDRWLKALDRRFFRERYDSQKILTSLIERVRDAPDSGRLCGLIEEEVNRTLHLRSLAVLVLEPATSTLVGAPGSNPDRELATDGDLAARLIRAQAPMEIDLERPGPHLRELSFEAQEWISDGGFRLLAPILDAERALLGVIALGEKESELPFSSEDRSLLSTIASSAAVAIERQLLRSSAARQRSSVDLGVAASTSTEWVAPAPTDAARRLRAGERACECVECARIEPAGVERCSSCGGALVPIGLPIVLLGKFRLLERVGRGGMGVVYRAEDLQLGRQVAIKTLPRMSARQSSRLRREARAIAAVEHPNLAMIYAVESLHSLPLLIFEYLGGGTLADRIRRGRLPVDEALRLGLKIADVVESIHAAGILHRDIKPSNIGFSEKGAPKLLDFGLAKLLLSAQEGAAAPAPRLEEVSPESTSVALSRRGRSIVGTPMYLSPEALRGAEPDSSFDVWSLCVVLYETLSGQHPFKAATAEQTIARILSCSYRDLDETMPGSSEDLRSFFTASFSRKRSRRPADVQELLRLLGRLDRAAA